MKRTLLILLFVLVGILNMYAQDPPREIVDSSYIWQRKSHFHAGTWEHHPEWWYNLWYRRYQENYNNNATQWVPLNVFESAKTNYKQKEKNNIDTIANKKTDVFLSQMVDVAYLMEYNTLDTLKQACRNAIDIYRYSASPDCEYNSTILDDRYNTLVSNIHTTNISNAESAEKREAYQQTEKDFIKLIDVVCKLNRVNNLINRHNN